MVKIKEILENREVEMLRHYQWMILNTDIEDFETIENYQNEIFNTINKAKKRYYEENPSVVPLKLDTSKESNSLNKKTLKMRELLTKEEEAEIDFLRWRITKSITPWGIKYKKKKIDNIMEAALKRNGYDSSILD